MGAKKTFFFFIALMAVGFSPLCSLHAQEDAAEVEEPPGLEAVFLEDAAQSSQEENVQFGDLREPIVLYLSDRPWFVSKKDIDAWVGSPWFLHPSTQAKLDASPLRLKLEIYGALLKSLPKLRFSSLHVQRQSSLESGSIPRLVSLPRRESQELVNTISDSLLRHFRASEIADLGVYLLAKQGESFFPKNWEEWDHWKEVIVNNDIWLGLALVLIQASSENGSVGAAGWFPHAGDEKLWRLGWYVSAKELGFELRPKLRAGLQLATPEVDVELGTYYHVNPLGLEEAAAVEFTAREHWLRHLIKPGSWEISGAAAVRALFGYADEERRSPVQASAGVLAQKTAPLGLKNITSVIQANGVTDFKTYFGGQTSIGVEHSEYDITALAQASLFHNPSNEQLDLQSGIFLAGSSDAFLNSEKEEQRSLHDRTLTYEAYLKGLEKELRAFKGSHKGLEARCPSLDPVFGSYSKTAVQKLAEEDRLRCYKLYRLERWASEARRDLEDLYKNYARSLEETEAD
ncbi:MAG: hypothetical protein AB1540_05800 [Bdellovibrionota bacterium]